MKPKKYPMTKSGKQAILQELDTLQTQKRTEALDRIKKARSFCDFREDSEYAAAMKAQAQLEERILLLLDMLENAEMISKKDHSVDTIVLGTPVTFIELPNGETETYTIVGIAEADPLNGTISNDSPLAKGLLGRSVGDEVSLRTPGGEIKLQIVSIG
ncbi:transcription elongation factor GreA [Sporosarcina sp. FA9]|uniref:transcription elongation factor GreA n=1 Tax=Sporosarcina sp. FA9 TaxID=3413030 RepID=UPI003F65A602